MAYCVSEAMGLMNPVLTTHQVKQTCIPAIVLSLLASHLQWLRWVSKQVLFSVHMLSVPNVSLQKNKSSLTRKKVKLQQKQAVTVLILAW